MIRFLLTLFGVCPHTHYRRERTERGVLMLVCDGCARTIPAIDRTAKERRVMAQRFKAVVPTKARLQDQSKVTPMRRRAK